MPALLQALARSSASWLADRSADEARRVADAAARDADAVALTQATLRASRPIDGMDAEALRWAHDVAARYEAAWAAAEEQALRASEAARFARYVSSLLVLPPRGVDGGPSALAVDRLGSRRLRDG